MVVEFLTFDVPVDIETEWLARDDAVWTAFLQRQDGFVGKEMWRAADPSASSGSTAQWCAVIWWKTLEQWKSIGPDQVATVDASMGELLIEPTCHTFTVDSSTATPRAENRT